MAFVSSGIDTNGPPSVAEVDADNVVVRFTPHASIYLSHVDAQTLWERLGDVLGVVPELTS